MSCSTPSVVDTQLSDTPPCVIYNLHRTCCVRTVLKQSLLRLVHTTTTVLSRHSRGHFQSLLLLLGWHTCAPGPVRTHFVCPTLGSSRRPGKGKHTHTPGYPGRETQIIRKQTKTNDPGLWFLHVSSPQLLSPLPVPQFPWSTLNMPPVSLRPRSPRPGSGELLWLASVRAPRTATRPTSGWATDLNCYRLC